MEMVTFISYRISTNYGLVEFATLTNSNGVDLFGPTVNICSKIIIYLCQIKW